MTNRPRGQKARSVMSSETTSESVHQETENPTRAPLSDAEKVELKAIVEKGRAQSLQDSLGALWRLGRLDDAVVELAAFQCGYWAPATHKWPTYRGHNIHYVSSLGAAAALAAGVERVEADPKASLKEKMLHTGMYIVPSILRSDAAHKYGHGEWIRCEKDKGTVTEAEVSESRVLVLDVDVAPLGGSREANTTQAEWSVSLHRAWLIRRWLLSLGCPESALGFANSGNGAHLVLALSGEFTKDVKDLRVRLLHAAAQVWDMERAGSVYIVDPSLADGARYIPLYGTKKRKAAHHKERPQRRTWLVAPDTVEALDVEAFRALVEAAEADVTDEERSAYEALQARHKPKQAAQKQAPPVQPAAASSTTAAGKSTKLTECDRVPVSQVLGALGEDVEHPTCLWCGRNDKTFVLQDEDHNGVKCHHANSCGRKVQGPVSLVAKAVADVDTLQGDKEGTKKVLHWFAEKGLIVLEKRSKKKSRKAPKSKPRAAEGEAVDQTPEEVDHVEDERPVIQISPDEKVVNDQAIQVLAERSEGLYQRGRDLVTVVDGAICDLPQPTLREILSSLIRWETWSKTAEGYVHASPPSSAVSAIFCRGDWGLPPIRGVVEGPCLRADGSVLAAPGYDAASGVFVRGSVRVNVPERPSKDDAVKAWAKLEDLITDFPFAEEMDKAAALSLLLTPGVRATLDGPAPFQLIRANTPGTGKGLLAQVASMIWTGAVPAGVPPISGGNPDETRKRFLPLVMEGRPIALFEDLRSFGGPVWAANLTLKVLEDRLLGESRIISAPIVTTFIGTGNNTSVLGDCLRRVVVTMMASPYEKPEQRPRESFRHRERAFSLIPYVRAHRAELLSACLTILRAYQVAGCPDHPTWGSYEEWSRVVAGAVTWLGLPDPCTSADRLGDEAVTDRSLLGSLFEAWRDCFGGSPQTASQVLDECKMSTELDDGAARLQYAVLQLCGCRDGKLPTALSLSTRLASFAGRVVDDQRIESGYDSHRKTKTWTVAQVVPATTLENRGETRGTAGTAGTAGPEVPADFAAENSCHSHFAGTAGTDLHSIGDSISNKPHGNSTDPTAQMDEDRNHSHTDGRSVPASTRNEAELAEFIDERLRVLGIGGYPQGTRRYPQGSAGDPSPATTEHLPPPACVLPHPPPGSPMPTYPTSFEAGDPAEERAEYAELAELAREKLQAAFTNPLLAALDAVEDVTDPADIEARAEQAVGAQPDLEKRLRVNSATARYCSDLASGRFVLTPEQRLQWMQAITRAEVRGDGEVPWPPGMEAYFGD